MAAAAGANCRDISKLVLWDPITDGGLWARDLCAGQEALGVEAGASNFIAPDGTLYLNGFAMPAEFRRGLADLQIHSIDISSIGSVLHIVSHESPASNELREHWSSRRNVSYQHCPAPHDWNYVDHIGSIMLPQPIIAAIKGWFN
jgi:hypothetical protein